MTRGRERQTFESSHRVLRYSNAQQAPYALDCRPFQGYCRPEVQLDKAGNDANVEMKGEDRALYLLFRTLLPRLAPRFYRPPKYHQRLDQEPPPTATAFQSSTSSRCQLHTNRHTPKSKTENVFPLSPLHRLDPYRIPRLHKNVPTRGLPSTGRDARPLRLPKSHGGATRR